MPFATSSDRDLAFAAHRDFIVATYNYTIVLTNGEAIERAGVATSVLKWTDGKWQIISLHSSSRKPKT